MTLDELELEEAVIRRRDFLEHSAVSVSGGGQERLNAVTDSEILTAFQRFEEGWKWKGLNA